MQQVAAQDAAHDVDEGVHHAHLVKMDVLRGGAMGEAFSVRQSVKDVTAPLLHGIRQRAGRKDPTDARQRKRFFKSVPDHDVHFHRMKRPASDVPPTKPITAELEAFQSSDQVGPGQACAHQRAQHHVAADSRKTIEMQMSSHEVVRPNGCAMAAHLTQRTGQRQSFSSDY